MPNTLIVCGGRHYQDAPYMFRILDAWKDQCGIDMIVHGSATGADTLAGDWADQRDVDCLRCPARWKTEGYTTAGFKRNGRMLQLAPDNLVAVIAFPGNNGTADMVSQALKAGVPVYRYDGISYNAYQS